MPDAPDTATSLPSQASGTLSAWDQSARTGMRVLQAAVLLMAMAWAASNCRRIAPDAQAVVLRLGQPVRQQGAGLLLAWPRPIETVLTVPAPTRQLRFVPPPFDAHYLGVSDDPRANGAFLLTGDTALVHLQATLFYRVADPLAYRLVADRLEAALGRSFAAAALAVCASRDIDAILVTRDDAGGPVTAAREQFRAELLRATGQRLAALAAGGGGFGVTLTRIDVSTALPDTVLADADRIVAATQHEQAVMADARTWAFATGQAALRTTSRIHQEAEAEAAEQVDEARSHTATVALLGAREATLSPAGLLASLYDARIGRVLSRAQQVDTVDAASGARSILSAPGAR